MTCAQAGMNVNASGPAVVVMWNYFVAPISFSSSERRSWMLSCGPEERVCSWQKTWDLYTFLSWTNSEFAVPTTLGNFSLSLPASTVKFSCNLSCNCFCMLGLRLSPWDLVTVPDGASTNKPALGKQCAENCACGGTICGNFHVPVPLVYAGSSGQLLAYHGTDVYQFADAGVECALGAAFGEVQTFPRDPNRPRSGGQTTGRVVETVQKVPS